MPEAGRSVRGLLKAMKMFPGKFNDYLNLRLLVEVNRVNDTHRC
jgi:hypothetical protein